MRIKMDISGYLPPKKPSRSKINKQFDWWVTEHFRNETELQNAIELILKADGIEYWREAKSWGNRSRADFSCPDRQLNRVCLYLEAKIDGSSTSMDRALGQALRNAVNGLGVTWVVIPCDIKIYPHHVESLRAIGSDVVRIDNLAERLRGFDFSGKAPDFRCLNQKDASLICVSDEELLTARTFPKGRHQELYRLSYKRKERIKAFGV